MKKIPRISKVALFRVIVIFCLVDMVYLMWSSRSSWSQTHCITKQTYLYKTDLAKSSTLSCGSPCTEHESISEYKELSRILKTYQTLHKSELEKVTNGQAIKSLTWYCITGCGGIGDRMKGMYAAFLLALAMNRIFFIYQSEEVQKTMYIEPNAIDWRPVNACINLHSDAALDCFGCTSMWENILFGESNDFHLVIDQMKSKSNVFITLRRSIGILINDIEKSSLVQENQQLIRILVSLWKKHSLQCLMSVIHQYLFQVPQEVVNGAVQSLKLLSVKPQNFLSVHIRTGFMNSYFGEITPVWSYLEGIRFARTPESWRGIMDCALKTADSVLGNHTLLLVSSDDQEPKDWAVATYGARIRILNIHPVHVSQKWLTAASTTDHSFLQNWIELAVMAQSRAIVSIHSGFTEVASHMCSMSPESFYTYSIAEKWCQTKH